MGIFGALGVVGTAAAIAIVPRGTMRAMAQAALKAAQEEEDLEDTPRESE